MNRFYAPNLTKHDNVYHLDGDESRHCIKVLRNNIGDKVELINGKGLLAIAHISDIKKSDCILNIESFLKKENYPETHLAIAPTKSSDKIEWLVEKASELGFDLVGAIPVSRSKTIDIYNSWLKKGYAGSMSYLERHADLKEDPRRLLPETISLIALGFNYKTVDPSEQVLNPEIGCISRYAWGDDYHELIRSKLNVLEDFLCRELNAGKLSRSFVDSGPILEREVAQRAGLGWIGKHSNLINWEKGSWLFLAELLVDVKLETELPFTRVDCGSCTICIEACPTEAITMTSLFEMSVGSRDEAVFDKDVLLVGDDGVPNTHEKQTLLTNFNELKTSDGWMRATSSNGNPNYQNTVSWTGSLGVGKRDPEKGQFLEEE